MEGWSFDWVRFNHRVSYLEYGLDADAARVSVIGGTSTTAQSPELDAQCDPDTCDEFPFVDDAEITVRWASATTRDAVFGTGTAVLDDVGPDGVTQSIDVPLPRKVRGQPVAIINGYVLDTNNPLSGGEACYRPEYGWHPHVVSVSLEPTLSDDGKSVAVDVTAVFDAGNSLEDSRQCIDEVSDEARVAMSVDVLVIAGKAPVESHQVAYDMAYEFGCAPGQFPCTNPAEQPDPDPSDRGLPITFDDPLLGWSSWAFEFHVDDPDDRGAYIRSWVVDASAADGIATGHATNYSPNTQLSGFDYAFTGTVVGVDLGAEVERGVIADEISVELDEQDRPVVYSLPL